MILADEKRLEIVTHQNFTSTILVKLAILKRKEASESLDDDKSSLLMVALLLEGTATILNNMGD